MSYAPSASLSAGFLLDLPDISNKPSAPMIASAFAEKFNDYAYEVARRLGEADVRTLVDDRNEKIGKKIRENEMKRIPYMLIVGEKEQENDEVSVRKQGQGDQGSIKISTFAEQIAQEVKDSVGH